jgi:hypothetical protein
MSSAILHRRAAWAVLAVAVLSVAACGTGTTTTTNPPSSSAATSGASSGASGAPGGGPLACDLVTTAMIQSALGTTVAAGTPAVLETGGSTCEFKDAGILVRVFPDRDAAFVQSMKGSFTGAIDVPAVGDAAFYSKDNATIMVLKGSTVVQVQAPNQNDQAKLVALAAAIVASL